MFLYLGAWYFLHLGARNPTFRSMGPSGFDRAAPRQLHGQAVEGTFAWLFGFLARTLMSLLRRLSLLLLISFCS
jgi:hypothetical protein